MSWFEEVADYLKSNLESYAQHFFNGTKRMKATRRGFQINPCPFCGKDDSFHANYDGYVNCFKCDIEYQNGKKPSLINAIKMLEGEDSYIKELEAFTGIQYKRKPLSPEKKAEYDKNKRLEAIYAYAVEFYHRELMKHPDALKKQTGNNLEAKERGHTVEALAHFRVGYSEKDSFAALTRELHNEGYTRDEVSEARKFIRIPGGLFVYPCFDAKGKVVRLNTKLHFRGCYGGENYESCDFYTFDLSKEAKKEHEEKHKHTMVSNGYSSGPKEAFFTSYTDLRRRGSFGQILLVEGENDAITAWESLRGTKFEKDVMVCAIGGNIGEEQLQHPRFEYLRQFKRIIEAFDHDEKGVEYRAMFNRFFTDIPYYTVKFGEDDFDELDIDDYLKTSRLDVQEVENLFTHVVPVLPDDNEVRIELVDSSRSTNKMPKHIWTSTNRKGQIRFSVMSLKGRRGSQQLAGDIELYKGKDPSPWEYKRDVTLANMRAGADHSIANLRVHLMKHLANFYEEFPTDEEEMPLRSDDELLTAYAFSKYHNEINRQLARRLLATQQIGSKAFDALVNTYKKAIGGTAFEGVRTEMTAIANGNVKVESGKTYPMIQLSANFDVENEHAMFYFVKNIQDNDAIAAVPCLISNSKIETRLDLLKRREKTHMLLIENKYQIPSEMEAAPLKMEDCSLQPQFVEMWKNDEITEDIIEPKKLLDEIKEIIEEVYYFRDKNVSSVLALWIYGTYYYTMYEAFPYIELSGRKGSGKSTLDTIISALALNARMTASVTPAAIYRMLNLTGGTLVLDEMENLSDKGKNDQSDFGPILKAGYSNSSGSVFRMNMDTGEAADFSVYSPKVISSINGMDDVLRDRSILITTHPAPSDSTRTLVGIGNFRQGDRLRQVHSLTSRCALSAMTHFMDVAKEYQVIRSDNSANRLSQIMIPLQTMAALAGDEYDQALTAYYDTEIKASKQYTFENTLEGRMKGILRQVALELTGLESSFDGGYSAKFLDTSGTVMYSREIIYNETTGTIEITTLHLKFLIEAMTDTIVSFDDINRQARLLLGSQTRASDRSKRASLVIKNDMLSRMFNGKARLFFSRYTFDLDECLDEKDMERLAAKKQNILQANEAPF